MGAFHITTMTNQDERFYPVLGPYLARREIIMSLSSPLYDDPGKIWFIAENDGMLAGFGALVLNEDTAHFCSDYVLPEYRRCGLHTQLVATRLEYASGRAKRATVTATIAGSTTYRRAGFVETKTRRSMKRFVQMEKVL